MRGLFLILVLAVACSCEEQCTNTPEAIACLGLLEPTQSKEAMKAVMNKCIAAQPGLQATIDELKAAEAANASLPSAGAKAANASLHSAGAKAANASLPSAGTKAANASLHSAGAKAANASLPSAGANVTRPDPGCKESRNENPPGLLKAAGKTAEMATLNKCLAKEKGYLVGAARGISIFDVAKFKAEIKAKVAGTSSQANTQLGLDKCPEDDLAAFEVCKYMKCVKAFCATGAGPINMAQATIDVTRIEAYTKDDVTWILAQASDDVIWIQS